MTYSFLNDYSEGCHPKILTALQTHNMNQDLSYGSDVACAQATKLFRQKTNCPNADVYYVTGGTQANLICLASMLKPFEAVIAVETAHIAANEAGAIETTGHKIITKPSANGKLTTQDVKSAVKHFSLHPHMVRPKVVYITNATETGTVYSKQELTDLAHCCKQLNLYLYLDGARLAMALASDQSSGLSLADVASLTDMFWFGGTKNGALIGEAIVITNNQLKQDFAFHLKQRGALLAKTRLLGAQFETLLTDDLYLQLAHHANAMAKKISKAIVHSGFKLVSPTHSNQVFAVLPHAKIEQLKHHFSFYEWEKRTNDSVVRLVTSWATNETQVNHFIDLLNTTE